jgi:hypothetical protein
VFAVSAFKTNIEKCKSASQVRQCVEKKAQEFYTQVGSKKAIQAALEISQDKQLIVYCHAVMHSLGRALLTSTGSVAMALAGSVPYCGGGMYHGILLQAFPPISKGSRTLSSKLLHVCKDAANASRSQTTLQQCHHGLGHLIGTSSDFTLPESLSLCDEILDPTHLRQCYSGVFMQKLDPSASDTLPFDTFVPRPHALCASLDKRYQQTCYEYAVLAGVMHTTTEAIERCLDVPTQYVVGCIGNYGANRTGYSRDPLILKSWCDLVPKGLQNPCVSALSQQLATNNYPRTKEFDMFCQQYDKPLSEPCIRGAMYAYMGFFPPSSSPPQILQKICEKYQLSCIVPMP